MLNRIASIVFIYICTAVAWIILGTTVVSRTYGQDVKLKGQVEKLWGSPQHQVAASVLYAPPATVPGPGLLAVQPSEETIPLEASTIDADLDLEYRQKGLLWYSTYRIKFAAEYKIKNKAADARQLTFTFKLPAAKAVYDDFRVSVGDENIEFIQLEGGSVKQWLTLGPDQTETVKVSYRSQGLDEWWYEFGGDMNQVRDFSLTVRTNFEEIDFPQNGMSPTQKERADGGWVLTWQYDNLLSGVQIGVVLPQRLNPGPWVSKVSFAAPVSLFLFFFLLFVFTVVKQVRIHPMNYFFVAAAFFSFHLLLAYLVDHVSIHLSFLICALVSILLVVSYMRLVAGSRFAFIEVGISQFVYLALFSYTFFFQGYTGLAITILSIVTLFVVMQITGRIDWAEVFQAGRRRVSGPAFPPSLTPPTPEAGPNCGVK